MYQDYVELHLHLHQNSSQDLLDVIHLLQIDDSTDPLRLHRHVYEELRLHDLLQVQVDQGIVVETNGLILGCEIVQSRAVGDHAQESEVILQDHQDLPQDPHQVAVEVGVQNVGVVDVPHLAVQSLLDLVIDHGQDRQPLKVFLGVIIGKMIVLSIAILHLCKRG